MAGERQQGAIVPGMTRELSDGGLLQEIRKLKLGPKDILVFKMDGGEWGEKINQGLLHWLSQHEIKNPALAIGDCGRAGLLVQTSRRPPEIDVIPVQVVRDLLRQLDMKPKDRDWSIIDKIRDLVADDD